MLAHHLRHGTAEGRLAGEHVPEGDAERINVRPHVDFPLFELLGAGKVRRAHEAAQAQGGRVLPFPANRRLGQAEIDDFGDDLVVFLDQHEIRRLNVPVVPEAVLGGGVQGARHLSGDLQRGRSRGQRCPPV